MKSHLRPDRSIVPLMALALFATGIVAPALRAQGSSNQPFAAGTECLRWLLKNSNLDPVDDAHQLDVDPRHTILIVLGDLGWLHRDTGIRSGVVSFVERGGALLAASDRRSGPSIKDLAGVTISGDHLWISIGKQGQDCHQDQPDRPFVIPESRRPDEPDNPFEGLRVATNIPSFLTVDSRLPGIRLLAHLPDRGYALGEISSGNAASTYERKKTRANFAVGGVRGEGRFLVLADHSIFINEMMLANDCSNFSFTVRCLEWLNEERDRTKVMLVEDGKAYPSFDVQLRPLPSPPPFKILEGMYVHRDEVLDEAQHRLAEWHERGDDPRYARSGWAGQGREGVLMRRYVLWAVGGFLAAIFLYRLNSDGRHLSDRRVPLLASAVARQRPTRVLADQRQYEQLDAGNLWESARVLARQRLAANAVAIDPSQSPQIAGGSWRRRRAARLRLERLQAIAYGAAPVQIRPERWENFLADLDAFDRDVTDGTVKLPAV